MAATMSETVKTCEPIEKEAHVEDDSTTISEPAEALLAPQGETPLISEDLPPAKAEENSKERETTPPELREGSPFSEGSVEEVVAATAKDVRAKKREDKSIEHVLRALSSLETTEEKLAALCKKYTDLLDEHKKTQTKFKQNQRKLAVISREKEQLQSEHSKAVLAKSKLESLCRELQRHNKLVKDESLARAREEEEKRKEVTSKFQTTINEIQKQMNDYYEKNTKLREENVELANKLKSLIEQYELREQHIEKVFKHKELEQQLADAKLAQTNLMMQEEKERNMKEKHLLVLENEESQNKIRLLQEQEKHLRTQVTLYTDKYEDFQQTLAKSNDVFQSFKVEMDKMTKKIKKLEKETTMWKTRWENSNKALIDMAEDKTRSDREILSLNSKLQKLESLCRAMQQERKQHDKARAASEETKVTAEAETNGVVKVVDPTKTPPNTPEEARASPVTVPQQNGPQTATVNGGQPETNSGEVTQSEERTQPEGSPDQSETVKQESEGGTDEIPPKDTEDAFVKSETAEASSVTETVNSEATEHGSCQKSEDALKADPDPAVNLPEAERRLSEDKSEVD